MSARPKKLIHRENNVINNKFNILFTANWCSLRICARTQFQKLTYHFRFSSNNYDVIMNIVQVEKSQSNTRNCLI